MQVLREIKKRNIITEFCLRIKAYFLTVQLWPINHYHFWHKMITFIQTQWRIGTMSKRRGYAQKKAEKEMMILSLVFRFNHIYHLDKKKTHLLIWLQSRYKEGRIHGYPSRVRVGRGCFWGYLIICADLVRPKIEILPKK